MKTTLKELGYQVKIHREEWELTQEELAKKINIDRTVISNLENGRMPDDITNLSTICKAVKLPKPIWEPFSNDKSLKRIDFERLLEELCGETISTDELDNTIISVIEDKIEYLFGSHSLQEYRNCLKSIIVYYGIMPLSDDFFNYYFETDSFRNFEAFKNAILTVKKDAIMLFSSMNKAYTILNSSNKTEFDMLLLPMQAKKTDSYTTRTVWNIIEKIPKKDLPKLGFISAEEQEQEKKDRKELSKFLKDIVKKKTDKQDKFNIETAYTDTKRREMSSLLDKFDLTIDIKLFDSLWNPDIDNIEREAGSIILSEEDFEDRKKAQDIGYRNLSKYLSADYMDVYIATSMRSDAEYFSVNQFVEDLFNHDYIRQLRLRYFDPTQAWIGDRVAKGLVEALMLRRTNLCIYMAQKGDTFGKDSEASVTLGQGKPVVIYVPKLFDKKLNIDSEKTGQIERGDLVEEIKQLGVDPAEITEKQNKSQLHAKLIHAKLNKATDEDYIRIIKNHWADFDIKGELDKKLKQLKELDKEKELDKDKYKESLIALKKWVKEITTENSTISELENDLKELLRGFLVSITMNFEKRAKTFRESHPLALQIISISGVLNGILVVRSIDSCAKLVKSLIENKLELEIYEDDDNYKLIEKNTFSTIRVISKHKLIANAFKTYYKKKD